MSGLEMTLDKLVIYNSEAACLMKYKRPCSVIQKAEIIGKNCVSL